MILEKIIFNLLAFAIFTVVFFRMVRKNDTNYLYLLLFEFFGILLNFIELIAKVEFNVFLKIIIIFIFNNYTIININNRMEEKTYVF